MMQPILDKIADFAYDHPGITALLLLGITITLLIAVETYIASRTISITVNKSGQVTDIRNNTSLTITNFTQSYNSKTGVHASFELVKPMEQ